ncbi:MAG TPA: transposase [Cyclobacteriaceae bacterium]|jgi:REP element-mobilizing transposase RayT|nr:transposase [Cyclobacteriaceae bacterium]
MRRKHKFVNSNKLYFISFGVIHWIDLFIRKEYRDIVLDSWRQYQREKDLEIYGWCIMTSHVHLIVGTRGMPLEQIIEEMKSSTSRSLRKAIENNAKENRREWMVDFFVKAGLANNDWQVWQAHSHPIELKTSGMFQHKLQYIHNHPVEIGLAERSQDYWYSSARDFYGRKGLIDLSFVILGPNKKARRSHYSYLE